MNRNENKPATLYESIPAVAALNRVPGFNPADFLEKAKPAPSGSVKGEAGLGLLYKKLWFRLANPMGSLKLNALRITEQLAIFEAQVFLDRSDPEPVGMFTASCRADELSGGRYIEEAQERALGVALSDAGFGMQFADAVPGAADDQKEIPGRQTQGNPGEKAGTAMPGKAAQETKEEPRGSTAEVRNAQGPSGKGAGNQAMPNQSQRTANVLPMQQFAGKTPQPGTGMGRPAAGTTGIQRIQKSVQGSAQAPGRILGNAQGNTQGSIPGTPGRQVLRPSQLPVQPATKPQPVSAQGQLPGSSATKPQPATVQEQLPISSVVTHQPASVQEQLPVSSAANPQTTSVQGKLPVPPAAKSLPASTHNQLPVPPVVKGQPEVQEAQKELPAPASNAGSAQQGLTDVQKAAAILGRKEEKPESAARQVSAHENGSVQKNVFTPENGSASENVSAPENVSILETGEVKYTRDMPVEDIVKIMTPDEAKKVVVDTGVCSGWTLEEVAERRPPSLKFYVYGDYNGKNNILRAAAQVMLDEMARKKAG